MCTLCEKVFGLHMSSKSTILTRAANDRPGLQDSGESQAGGHGHLQADRHHGQTVRCGSATQLRGHVKDVQRQSGQVAPGEGGYPSAVSLFVRGADGNRSRKYEFFCGGNSQRSVDEIRAG